MPNTCSHFASTNTCSSWMKQSHLETEHILELTNTLLRTSLGIRSEHQNIWSWLRTRTTVREHPNTVHKQTPFVGELASMAQIWQNSLYGRESFAGLRNSPSSLSFFEFLEQMKKRETLTLNLAVSYQSIGVYFFQIVVSSGTGSRTMLMVGIRQESRRKRELVGCFFCPLKKQLSGSSYEASNPDSIWGTYNISRKAFTIQREGLTSHICPQLDLAQ